VEFPTVDLAFDPYSGAFIWLALEVIAAANGVDVTLRAFDFATGEDVFQGAAVWSCVMDDGAIFLAEDYA
jgi:hypothetical protein